MTRVLIASDETLFNKLLSHVLRRESDIILMQPISDLALLPERAPAADIVLLGIGSETETILRGIAELRRIAPNTNVIVMRVPDVPEEILPFLEAGAHGYLRSSDEVEQLLDVIYTVKTQGAYVDATVAPLLVRRLAEISRALAKPATSFNGHIELTPRELEIVELIFQGQSNRQIAGSLNIGLGTVKNHVHNVLHKLEVRNRDDIVRWYAWRQRGLVPHGALSNVGAGRRLDWAGNLDGAGGPDGAHPGEWRGRETHSPIHWQERERALIQETLDLFCTSLGWPLGHLFVLDRAGELKPSAIWYCTPDERFQRFRETTDRLQTPDQSAVLTSQLEHPRPVWIIDIRLDRSFRRRAIAETEGLRSALFLPIVHEGRTVGVMEFFTTLRTHPDPEAVATIMQARETLSDVAWPVVRAGDRHNMPGSG